MPSHSSSPTTRHWLLWPKAAAVMTLMAISWAATSVRATPVQTTSQAELQSTVSKPKKSWTFPHQIFATNPDFRGLTGHFSIPVFSSGQRTFRIAFAENGVIPDIQAGSVSDCDPMVRETCPGIERWCRSVVIDVNKTGKVSPRGKG